MQPTSFYMHLSILSPAFLLYKFTVVTLLVQRVWFAHLWFLESLPNCPPGRWQRLPSPPAPHPHGHFSMLFLTDSSYVGWSFQSLTMWLLKKISFSFAFFLSTSIFSYVYSTSAFLFLCCHFISFACFSIGLFFLTVVTGISLYILSSNNLTVIYVANIVSSLLFISWLWL